MISNHITDLTAYIALGDSISIDLYPALDAGGEGNEPLGAASLFHKKLFQQNPKIEFANLCADGAVTWDLMDEDALHLVEKYRDKKVLITLTIGGNDLLTVIRQDVADIVGPVSDVVLRIEQLAKILADKFPQATMIMNSIYDPTDGTGVNMPYLPDLADKLPFLRYVNTEIKKIAEARGALFADIYTHFQGHGIGKPDTYFWPSSPIEPSAAGARALAELWLATLQM